MYRNIAKAGVLAGYTAFNFSQFAHNAAGLGVACFLLAVALISLSRKFAIEGDKGDPGILVMLTICFMLGTPTLMLLLPDLLQKIGVTVHMADAEYPSKIEPVTMVNIFREAGIGLLVSAYFWIPFALYWLIDVIANRIGKKNIATGTVA